MREREKFMRWFEAEQSKGLIDIKFFAVEVTMASSEDIFREANVIQDALDDKRIEELGGVF